MRSGSMRIRITAAFLLKFTATEFVTQNGEKKTRCCWPGHSLDVRDEPGSGVLSSAGSGTAGTACHSLQQDSCTQGGISQNS
jgi:hypothetical protein